MPPTPTEHIVFRSCFAAVRLPMSPSLPASHPDHRKDSDSSKAFQHARQIVLASTLSANASCTVRESRPGTACCAAQTRQ
ncbi:hypothetical protein HMPREF9622_00901 [Cutibacterium modestum HL037PA3]|nr:hypothetical protein HMPREF9622_00901 [Cutibacterium modestum HL037PA3]